MMGRKIAFTVPASSARTSSGALSARRLTLISGFSRENCVSISASWKFPMNGQ